MLRNHLQLDSYTTDKPLVYAVLVETYFTLGRALMAEKKSVFLYYNKNEKNRNNMFIFLYCENGNNLTEAYHMFMLLFNLVYRI